MAANISPMWNAFNSGELSSKLDGRTDQDKYFTGCKTLLNFIPTVQGPAFRRAGTRFRGNTRENAQAWFSTFEFSSAQSYVLEFTHFHLRFWVNRGLLLDAGVPYDVTTPWANTDLVTADASFSLRSAQSQDIMWITNQNGNIAPYKLSRLGATNWDLSKVPFTNGPFQDIDPDTSITVTPDASTGAVNLVASGAVFTAADVDTSFLVQMQNPGLVLPWATAQTTLVNDLIRYQGNFYRATAVGTSLKTGVNPPVHTEGSASDGVQGVTWLYLHSGYGWVAIDTVTDAMNASGTVVNYLPEQTISSGTTRWAHALFNDTDGWPTNVAFFRGRLCYARRRTLAFSVSGVYDDFSTKDGPDITVENGFVVNLAADRLDSVRWLAANDKVLLVGSSIGELAILEQTTQAVFSATNFTDRPQSKYGSRLVDTLDANDATLFVQRAGKKLREEMYDLNIDKYKAEDLTVLSPQVTEAGITDMDFQQEPDNIVWCVLNDGRLGALTYNRERGVIAWTPHYLGGDTSFTDGYGLVETVASISSPDGSRDDVWFSVVRQIDGENVRHVEYLEDPTLYKTSLADMFYVDAGITYSGAPAQTITGLDHLEGQTVQVLADGSTQADCVVTGGQITLLRAASKVQVGLQYKSQLQTMRPDGGVQTGSSQSYFKGVPQAWFLFEDTIGGQAGPSFDNLDYLPSMKPEQLLGVAKGVFSGWVQFEMPANQGTDGYVCFEQSQPFPATIQAITPRIQVSDD